MAGDEGATDNTSLERTPTYSVATAAATFIAVSVLMERGIHWLKKYLKRRNQRPLRKVLDKLTEELMLLGFISLLLTVLQSSVSKICVSPSFATHMLPCSRHEYEDFETLAPAAAESHVGITWHKRRLLAGGGGATTCVDKGKVPFISTESLHQLHIFIFVLAVVHVCYSCLTVLLGFLRVHHWQKWERETQCADYDGKRDLKKRYCDKQICKENGSSFVERYGNHPCSENPIFIWILCFFRQFVASVTREDYLTFRVGFLHNHSLGDSFNFRDYVIRSMEVDFKTVIGISWWFWAFVVVFFLLNVNGWYTYFWAAFIPLVLVLILGTKQQHVIASLALNAKRHALESSESERSLDHDPEQPHKGHFDMDIFIMPSDRLFWFDRPKLLLRLLHFVIFQNSFELAFLIWLRTSYGSATCFFGRNEFLRIRVVVGVLSQLLASYSTLPTYALISQMGSSLKHTVFTKDVQEGLSGWRTRAKKRSQHNSPRDSTASKDSSNTSTDKQSGEESKEGSVESTGKESGRRWGSARRLASNVRRVGSVGAGTQGTEAATQLSQADHLQRCCQRMYGKERGLEMIKAAQINPQDNEG